MTQDDIIRLALEHFGAVLKPSDLEVKLAALVADRIAERIAAAEKQKVVEYMNSRAFATGYNDTIDDLLKELEWQVAERERRRVRKWLNLSIPICD